MNAQFAEMAASLQPSFEALMGMEATGWRPPINMPAQGIYLFSENGCHLYVGRSNRLRKRYFLHCRNGSRHNQANFAFRLAREATGKTEAAYNNKSGRIQLAANPEFVEQFTQAKARIQNMEYRFVEETDQTRQALLEIYVSVALNTPYNDFNTH